MENKDFLEDYIDTKSKISAAVHDVLYNSERIDSAAQKHKIVGNGKLLAMFERKIDIIRNKRAYNDKKSKIQDAVKNLYYHEGKYRSIVAERLEITLDELNEEYEKYIKSPQFYVYDTFTLDREGKRGVFTFVEEDALIQQLCKFKEIILMNKKGCCCWVCTMNRLSFIAYNFAKDKGKELPESWDVNKKVDRNWLIDFEMRHADELLKNFLLVCPKSPSLPACHTEKCYKPSTCNVYPTSMQEGSDSSLNIPDIAIRSDERTKLKDHLITYKRIKSAVAEAIDSSEKEPEVIARTHGFIQEKEIYITTIDIIKNKNQYIKEEEGLKKIFRNFSLKYKSLHDVRLIDTLIRDLAKSENLCENLAVKEYLKNKWFIQGGNYKYVKVIEDRSTELFSKKVDLRYNEHFYLFEQLCSKKDELICKCHICASELLGTLVEKYIHNTRKDSNIWIDSTEKSYWLYSFIMRYRETFFETFPKDNCEEDTIFKDLEVKCQSSLLHGTEKESQSISTLRSQKRKLDSAQTSEDQTSQEHCSRRDTLKILLRNEEFQLAADEIITRGNEHFGAIAKEYNFSSQKDSETLNTIIDILKKNNKYNEEKNKIEKVLEAIISGKMSVYEAKHTTEINSEVLDKELVKFKKSKSEKVKYEYDEPTSDDAIFTFTQELSYLESFISAEKDPCHCWCYSCSMFHLRAFVLASKYSKEGEDSSSLINETTLEKWWFEFEVRHSRRISEMFLPPWINPKINKSKISDPLSFEKKTPGPSKIRRTE